MDWHPLWATAAHPQALIPKKELFPICCSSSWSCCLPSLSCPPKITVNPHDAQGRDWFQSLLGLSEMKDCSDFPEQMIHGSLAACKEGAH